MVIDVGAVQVSNERSSPPRPGAVPFNTDDDAPALID